MGTAKPFFGPVPARAAGDARLTGLHMKLLTAIAAHDRMSDPRGKGQGCWAGNKRLAEMIGCNYTNLSTALTELATWGYVDRRINLLNKRRRILHVVYDQRDATLMGAKPGGDSLPRGKRRIETVCPDIRKMPQDQSLGDGEYIPQKRRIYPAEAKEGNSVETTPLCSGGLLRNEDLPQGQRQTGRRLREIAALLKAVNGSDPTSDEFDALLRAQHECWDFAAAFEGETVGYWAARLADEIEPHIEGAA